MSSAITAQQLLHEASLLGKKHLSALLNMPDGEIEDVGSKLKHDALGRVADVGRQLDMSTRSPAGTENYTTAISKVKDRAERGIKFINQTLKEYLEKYPQRDMSADPVGTMCADVISFLDKAITFAEQNMQIGKGDRGP